MEMDKGIFVAIEGGSFGDRVTTACCIMDGLRYPYRKCCLTNIKIDENTTVAELVDHVEKKVQPMVDSGWVVIADGWLLDFATKKREVDPSYDMEKYIPVSIMPDAILISDRVPSIVSDLVDKYKNVWELKNHNDVDIDLAISVVNDRLKQKNTVEEKGQVSSFWHYLSKIWRS